MGRRSRRHSPLMATVLVACALLLLVCTFFVRAQYGEVGGYGQASAGTAVARPVDTIKHAIANRNPEYGLDIASVRRAQKLLDDGLKIGKDEQRMDISWARASNVPMGWCAYQLYLQHGVGKTRQSGEIRRFFINLVDAGMSADIDYLGEGLLEGSWLNLPLANCLNTREDVEVCLALLRANHPTDPVVGNWNARNAYGQQCVAVVAAKSRSFLRRPQASQPTVMLCAFICVMFCTVLDVAPQVCAGRFVFQSDCGRCLRCANHARVLPHGPGSAERRQEFGADDGRQSC